MDMFFQGVAFQATYHALQMCAPERSAVELISTGIIRARFNVLDYRPVTGNGI
jgi:hypothetical protein